MMKRDINIKIHLIYLQKRKDHFFHSEIRRRASLAKNTKEAVEILIKYPVSYYKYFRPSLKNNPKIIETLLIKDSFGFRFLPRIQKYNLKNIKLSFFFVNNYLRYQIRKTKIPAKQRRRIKYKINSDFLYQTDFKKPTNIIKIKKSIRLVDRFQFDN